MEEQLSLDELLLVLEKQRDLKKHEQEFLAALQGVKLDENNPQKAPSRTKKDITQRTRKEVRKNGFGIGNGLAYSKIGVK